MNNKLLPIKEVAHMLGVQPQTIRQWECKYALIRATRTEQGHRVYPYYQIKRMYLIQNLLQTGLTIEQIQTLIDD